MTIHEKNYWDAQEYAENSGVQTAWAKDFINNRMDLKNAKHILDIGCGDGRITAYLSELLPNTTIIGVDPSEEMVSLARSHQQHPNLSFTQSRGERFSAPTPQDVIVSFSCFHWIPDQKLLASTLAANLTKGGSLYFLCAPKVETNINAMLSQAMELPRWKEYFKAYSDPMFLLTPDEWKQLLNDAGLITQRIELKSFPERFSSLQKFSSWVAAWAPQVRHLPGELREAYMQDVMNLYMKAHPDKNPMNLIYDDRFLEVEAIRQ